MANELLRRITRGQYALGSRLPSERQLAEEFGVSRPVIREALGTLAAMEVVESQMGRGSFVISTAIPEDDDGLDVRGLIDVVRMREALECGALSMIATTQVRGEVGEGEAVVGAALEELRSAVASGRNTIGPDIALHRAVIAAVGSARLLRVFDDAHESILRSIQLSPRANTMGDDLLRQHEQIAAGVTKHRVAEALKASHRMHAEHRELLSRLLRE